MVWFGEGLCLVENLPIGLTFNIKRGGNACTRDVAGPCIVMEACLLCPQHKYPQKDSCVARYAGLQDIRGTWFPPAFHSEPSIMLQITDSY